MTDAEFEALIAEANARVAATADLLFARVKEDIHTSFQQAYENLNEKFNDIAQDLGVDLPEPPSLLSEFSMPPERRHPVQPKARILYDDGEFVLGYGP